MGQAIHIQELDDPDYDPFLADEVNFGDVEDPYPMIHKWRAEGAVHEGTYRGKWGLPQANDGKKHFILFGTDEINASLTDTARFSNAAYAATLGTSFGDTITLMDPPMHGKYRAIFQKIFLPQNVKAWGETIVTPVVNKLMSKFVTRGKADLIGEFTLHYPFEVIYGQLNLPDSDIRTFQRLAIAQTDFYTPGKAVEAGIKLGEYFQQLVELRRREPGDDLVTLLALTEVDGKYLPDNVLISFLRQLMNAGGDTTYRGTSVLLTALLEDPEQLDALRNDRDLLAQAVEEALRWNGPVLVKTRMAAVDMELGGVQIPKGAVLDVVCGAANRDPDIFDNPDQFSIFRKRQMHWGFGRGPHVCVGQHLARVEMTRAINAILDKLKNLRLDPDKPRASIRGCMMRVPKALNVLFDI